MKGIKLMEEFLQVGAIANTHGIAGEVKVFPMTEDMKFECISNISSNRCS